MIMETLLKKKIHSALNTSPHIPAHSLRFETDAGRVILSGYVPSWYQKQMAQEALRSVEGIAEIRNELRVVQTTANRFVL